jgi:hypothetical protein
VHLGRRNHLQGIRVRQRNVTLWRALEDPNASFKGIFYATIAAVVYPNVPPWLLSCSTC